MMEQRSARVQRTYLCDFDIINLELCVWMWLLCVEDLLYGDGSEGVFAISSLILSRQKAKGLNMTKNHLSSCTLAPTL